MRRLKQSILVNKNSTDNNDKNQVGTEEVHNTTPSDDGLKRGSCILEEFPIGKNVSKKRVTFKTLQTSIYSNVLEDPTKEKWLTNGLSSSFNPEQNTRVDEIASEVKDVKQKAGLILEKLDKIISRT